MHHLAALHACPLSYPAKILQNQYKISPGPLFYPDEFLVLSFIDLCLSEKMASLFISFFNRHVCR